MIEILRAYVDAQREYATTDWDGDGNTEFAQKVRSSPGKKDGLYWAAKEGEKLSPLGPLAAKAAKEGYTKESTALHGYHFKILKGQGKDAEGGAFDYLVNGKMILGYAMVAYPAQYGASGIMTFIVNQNGIVYQKNLGKNSGKIAAAMKLFNPDKSWKKVEITQTICTRTACQVLMMRHILPWNKWYIIRSYFSSSLWIIPFFAIVLNMVVSRLTHAIGFWLVQTGRLDQRTDLLALSMPGARTLLETIITLNASFTVFTFGSLLVAIQVASGQMTPRIIATTLLRDNAIRYSVGFFVFTMLFTLRALDQMERPSISSIRSFPPSSARSPW